MFPRRSDHGVPGAAVLGDGPGIDALFADARVREWFRDSGSQHLSAPESTNTSSSGTSTSASAAVTGTGCGRAPLPRRHPARTASSPWPRPTGPRPRPSSRPRAPRTHGQPFARPGQVWVGVRDADGALVACGGSEPSSAGTPTLAGIAVAGRLRRSGLGAAVSAHLTRRAVSEVGACALGMFADNAAARRVYERLGFVTGMEWRSRWLAPPPGPDGAYREEIESPHER